MAAERRLGRLAVPALFRAAGARALAARPRRPTPPRRSRTCRMPRRWPWSARPQFLPPPPPTLQNPRYATDLNEVSLIGRSNSATRTPEQTAIARLWAGIGASGSGTATNFMSIWNAIVRDVARERRLSLVETARVFVLVNVSVHDGLQTSQASKFVYGLWRPVTAIQQGDPFSGTTPDVDLDAAAHHAAVSVVRRQHGHHRRQRGPRPAARLRHQRHRR